MQTPRTPEEIARKVAGCDGKNPFGPCSECDDCETLEVARLAWAAGRKEAFGECAKEARSGITPNCTATCYAIHMSMAKWAEGKAGA